MKNEPDKLPYKVCALILLLGLIAAAFDQANVFTALMQGVAGIALIIGIRRYT